MAEEYRRHTARQGDCVASFAAHCLMVAGWVHLPNLSTGASHKTCTWLDPRMTFRYFFSLHRVVHAPISFFIRTYGLTKGTRACANGGVSTSAHGISDVLRRGLFRRDCRIADSAAADAPFSEKTVCYWDVI